MTHDDTDERFRRVEQRTGVGSVTCGGATWEDVRYDIVRFQGMTRAGLPVPGVHRFEGSVGFASEQAAADLLGRQFTLFLQDGSVMQLELLDREGRVVAYGHGPGKCGCC